jgi:hypothetical protein
MMAVPTIQATQAISFDVRKYAVPAKLKEMLISFEGETANLPTSRSRLSVAICIH